MPPSNKKKRAGTLRTAATAAKSGRTGRFPKAEILEHVNRFRALNAKTGITQEEYAADNRLAEGTLSRWLSENKETVHTVPAEDRPVRGFLSAGDDAGKSVDPKTNGHAEADGVPSTPPSVEELQFQLEAERLEKKQAQQALETALLRNGELKTAIKNLTGSL